MHGIRRFCRIARLVTLAVDLVPEDQQDRAEVLIGQVVSEMDLACDASYHVGRQESAAELAEAKAQIAALRLEIAAHAVMEAALITEPPTVTH